MTIGHRSADEQAVGAALDEAGGRVPRPRCRRPGRGLRRGRRLDLGDDVAVATTYLEREGQRTAEGGELPVRRNHSLKVLPRDGDRWLIVSELYMDAREEEPLVGDEPSARDRRPTRKERA